MKNQTLKGILEEMTEEGFIDFEGKGCEKLIEKTLSAIRTLLVEKLPEEKELAGPGKSDSWANGYNLCRNEIKRTLEELA